MSRTFTYNFTTNGQTADTTITTADSATDQSYGDEQLGYTDYGYGYDIQSIIRDF